MDIIFFHSILVNGLLYYELIINFGDFIERSCNILVEYL